MLGVMRMLGNVGTWRGDAFSTLGRAATPNASISRSEVLHGHIRRRRCACCVSPRKGRRLPSGIRRKAIAGMAAGLLRCRLPTRSGPMCGQGVLIESRGHRWPNRLEFTRCINVETLARRGLCRTRSSNRSFNPYGAMTFNDSSPSRQMPTQVANSGQVASPSSKDVRGETAWPSASANHSCTLAWFVTSQVSEGRSQCSRS